MKEIVTGICGKSGLTADESTLAVNVGSGSLEVLATPVMIMLMEKAACSCIAPYLENDETTVGTEVCVKHLSATPAGMKVHAEAVVSAVNEREITFDVKAFDEAGEIGCGTHKRFLVFGEKFTAKARAKAQN